MRLWVPTPQAVRVVSIYSCDYLALAPGVCYGTSTSPRQLYSLNLHAWLLTQILCLLSFTHKVLMDDRQGGKPQRRRRGGGHTGERQYQRHQGMHATNIVDESHDHVQRGRGRKPKRDGAMSTEKPGKGNYRHHDKFRKHATKREVPSIYLTQEDLQELASSDTTIVIERISQNEIGFLAAFMHDKFIKHQRSLKYLVKVLYTLVQSNETQMASRVLTQIFNPESKYSQFIFQLDQFLKQMSYESKPFIRIENLQCLFHLTVIGKFGIQSIPHAIMLTFPIQSMTYATKLFQRSDSDVRALEDIKQNLVELEVQLTSFQEEKLRPKPPRSRLLVSQQEPPEHISTISILPVPEEIRLYARKPFLRPNITKGSYRDWDHYIDVQFRLLREDFVGPLRQGIAEHCVKQTLKGGEVRVYHNVRIGQPVCLASGIGFEITFDSSFLRKVNWEYTKRLINGSLLCLSTDKFESMAFATVAQRETKMLQKGIVTVKFEGDIDGFQIDPRTDFTMVESVAYFEAYRHVLQKLKAVTQHDEIEGMPFQQYIVDSNFEVVALPLYVRYSGQPVFDLQGIIDVKPKHRSCRVSLKHLSTWPDAASTNLDPSQMQAMQAALTQELSVIQGPPGTGKTFIGMKIVQSFLANRDVWDPKKASPILVVCYTNHALDQFLEGIKATKVDGKEPNVTRIGGRCKSEMLSDCTLYVKVKKAREQRIVPRQLYKEYAEAKSAKKLKEEKIVHHLKGVYMSTNKILGLDKLHHFILEHHLTQLIGGAQTDNAIEEWLGLQYSTPEDDGGLEIAAEETHQEVLKGSELDSSLTEDIGDDDNEVQKILDDRLVEGCEVVYRAPELFDQTEQEKEIGKLQDGWQTVQMDQKKRQRLIHKQLSRGLQPMSDEESHRIYDLRVLRSQQRWRLYLQWRDKYVKFKTEQLELLSQDYKASCEAFEEQRRKIDHWVVRGSDVIGMTTTGAAKHNHIIQSIQPKIVVVEEAAEIFEPHIFTSLSPSVQQLVLIGDHQQLRPKPNFYTLEMEYDFAISLFERLAHNSCPVVTLKIQHRMRPEISGLITPSIYAELYNHSSVEEYGHVQGVGKDLFFIHHNNLELKGKDDGKSHSNPYEAHVLVAFCDYLLKQGYEQSEITILTLYRGQLLEIKKLMKVRKISGVRTSVVDDFQGEENQIILLSLVRSNHEQNIGFLGIENRICVALSRAKQGLYIIGNLLMLKDKITTVWPKVISKLPQGCLGEAIPLYCQVHPQEKNDAKTPEDFLKCPEGGCQKKCETRLQCGHVCRLICHPYDREHIKYKCIQKCPKVLPCGHKCRRKCYECSKSCKPCSVKVEKTLDCGHTVLSPCSAEFVSIECSKHCGKRLRCGHLCQEKCSNPCTVKCTVQVDKALPCGHTVLVACHLSTDTIVCPVPCGSLLDCEHTCPGTCGTCYMGRLHTSCTSECNRQLVCGHICNFPCTPSCPPCTKPCANFCNHSRCPKKCFERCTPCKEKCEWSCPHFQCTQPCGNPCDRPPCGHPCPKRLTCGHKCIGLCGELCPTQCRVCDKEEVTDILFGEEEEPDALFVLLPDCHHIIEVGGLDTWMETGNNEENPQEVALKTCPKCKTPIKRCLRYGTHIKRYLQDVERIKQKQLQELQTIDLKTEFTMVKRAVVSSPSFSSVLEELEVIERQVCEPPHSKERKSFRAFPFAVKAQLTVLSQIVKVSDIMRSTSRSQSSTPVYSVEQVKQSLNHLKAFIMNDFHSQQQISDAELEMRRLSLLAKLIHFKLQLDIRHTKLSKDHGDEFDSVLYLLHESGWKREKVSGDTETKYLDLISFLGKEYKVQGLTDTERFEIVKAIGLPKGHWFKCPNGHFYCIADCGGAMVTAKCPECGSTIGGGNHRLREDNQLAPEMDGAQHAAWSEGANLANFDPEDLARLQQF